MTYTFRNLLARLGLYSDDNAVAAKEAVTSGLVKARSAVLSELNEHAEKFKEKSSEIETATEQRKDDLDELLEHIQQINDASSSAQAILSRLIKRKRATLPLL
jgi:methyl-accepting chemotaxis protein